MSQVYSMVDAFGGAVKRAGSITAWSASLRCCVHGSPDDTLPPTLRNSRRCHDLVTSHDARIGTAYRSDLHLG